MKTLQFDETAPFSEARRRLRADFHKAYAEAVLKLSGGNMSEAARRAQMDRGNFRRLLRSGHPEHE